MILIRQYRTMSRKFDKKISRFLHRNNLYITGERAVKAEECEFRIRQRRPKARIEFCFYNSIEERSSTGSTIRNQTYEIFPGTSATYSETSSARNSQ